MIQLKNVSKVYKTKNKEMRYAIKDITLNMPDNGMIFIVGKSGSGKSTLLNMIGGLDSITSGSISVNNTTLTSLSNRGLINYRNNKIGFIFQYFYLLDHMSVKENIMLTQNATGIYDKSVKELLKMVDLSGYEDRYPIELSGGQQQRIAIARALAKNPDIILADEPTGNLDRFNSKKILDILKKISKDRLVIIVSHNINDAHYYADRIIELETGLILSDKINTNERKNELYIEDDILYLPYNINIKKEEEKFILESISNDKLKNIIQQNDGFIENINTNYESKDKLNLKNKGMNLKLIFKYIKMYLSKLKLNSVFIIIISVTLLLLISVMNSLNDKVYLETNRPEYGEYVRLTPGQLISNSQSLFSTKLEYVNSTMKNVVEDAADNIENYKFFAYQINFSQIHNNQTVYYTSDVIDNCKDFYLQEAYGVLECDKNFVMKNLTNNEEIEVLAGEIKNTTDEIIITDYLADSLIYQYNLSSYDEIIQSKKRNITSSITAIIKTNYKEKHSYIYDLYQNTQKESYPDLIEKLKKEKSYEKFLYDVLMFYGVGYNLSMNFKASENAKVLNNTLNWTFLSTKEHDVFKSITMRNSKSYLSGNSATMSYELYNQIFNTKYTLDDYPRNLSFEMDLMIYNNSNRDEIIETIPLKIKLTSDSYLSVSPEVSGKLQSICSNCISYYLPNDSNLDIIEKKLEGTNFYYTNIDSENVISIGKMMEIINEFFGLIIFLLYIALFIFVFLFGYNIIKKNLYDIGVMLAMGVKNSNIAFIFITNILINTCLICVSAEIIYPILIQLMNLILKSSFEVMLHIKIYYIDIVKINLLQLFENIYIILLLGMISASILIIRILFLKPINIIKAETKEV